MSEEIQEIQKAGIEPAELTLLQEITIGINNMFSIKTLQEVHNDWMNFAVGKDWREFLNAGFPDQLLQELCIAKASVNEQEARQAAVFMYNALNTLPSVPAPRKRGILII